MDAAASRLRFGERRRRCSKRGVRRSERGVVVALLRDNALRLSAIVAVTVLSFGCYHRASDPRPFDSAAWKVKPRGFQDKTRCGMVDSLLRDQALDGLSRPDVVALLGEQDDPSYFRSWDLRYWMGQEHGPMAIDSEWLVIRFKDGRVSEYAIVTD